MDEQQLRRIIRQEIRTIIRRKLQAFKRFRYRRFLLATEHSLAAFEQLFQQMISRNKRRWD